MVKRNEMPFDWQVWEELEGQLTRREADTLLQFTKDKTVLQIGHNLKSLYILGHHSKAFYAFEVQLTEKEQSVIDSIPDKARMNILRMEADAAFDVFKYSPFAQQKTDVIFLDGNQSYHDLCQNLRNYTSFLSNTGVIIIHDYLPYFHKGSAWDSIEIQEAILATLSPGFSHEITDSMIIIHSPKVAQDESFHLNLPPKQPRILLIGDMSNPVADYYELLKKIGYHVFWAGDNAVHLNTINFTSSVELNPFSMPYAGEAVVRVKRYPIKYLLDQIGHDFDLILHFQGWFQPSDLTCDIPYIYYCSEGWWPEIPTCATLIAVPNAQTKMLVLQANPHRSPEDISIIPFSIGALFNNRRILTNRNTEISWAGDIYRFGLLYRERREILTKLLDEKGIHIEAHWQDGKTWNADHPHWKQGKGFLNAEDYTTLLDNSQYGLNIPTRLGSNFRDLEVPACGAILVTKPTPDLQAMGFEHGKNCYFYNTYDELVQILRKPFNIGIAMLGYTLVNMQHRHIHRIPLFEDLFRKCGIQEPLGIKTGLYRWNDQNNKMGIWEPEFLLQGPMP